MGHLQHQQQPPPASGGAALGATSEAVSTTYAPHHHHHHHPLMPPPHNYPQPETSAAQAPTLSGQAHRYGKGEDLTRPPPGSSSSGVSAAAAVGGMSPPTVKKSPASTTTAIPKSSPLSLAAITSPFTPPDHHAAQSKNCHAQTFTLGERLRPGSQVLGDPVTLTPWRHHQAQYARRTKEGTPMRGTRHPSLSTLLQRVSVGSAI